MPSDERPLEREFSAQSAVRARQAELAPLAAGRAEGEGVTIKAQSGGENGDHLGGGVRYRTIVADPPWEYPDGCVALGPGHGELRAAQPLPYQGMPFEDICALPVRALADRDSRLFLWTTNRWLPDAFDVMGAWGFRYRQTLVWHKTDTNLVGSVAPNSAEFMLVGIRGAPERLTPLRSAVLAVTRKGGHSAKPEAWLDYIEQASPGPYAELFSRRARFGWSYPIGDQALGGIAA